MEVILDMQGFRDDNQEFIFKEIAILDISNVMCHSFLFKPPENSIVSHKSTQSQNHWLTNNHHGLTYESGHTPYSELQSILQDLTLKVSTVYVKGSEKRRHILNICPDINVVNLEETEKSLGIPTIKQLRRHFCHRACLWHKDNDSVCAVRNVLNVYLWRYGEQRNSPMSENDEECKTSLWCFCKQQTT